MTRLSLLFVAALALVSAASGQTDLTGGWVGEIERPGPGRNFLFIEFSEEPQGWVGAAEISVWASAARLYSIRIEGTQVNFEATTPSAPSHWVFRGKASDDAAVIEGTVRLGPDEWPFRLTRNAYALGLLALAAESLGEFDDGFAGRWHSDTPMSDGSRLRFVLRRTVYGFAAYREVWGSGDRLHKIEIEGGSIHFEMPDTTSNFAVLDPEGKYFKRVAPPLFQGALDPTGMHITGTWTEGGVEHPFTLHRYVGDPGLGN